MQAVASGTGVPITILTGFLGAGKTTLLNRILAGDHGLRAAVLVNDFGPINIDTQLVVGVEENTISLANGCVCCQIRDDLVDTMADLMKRPEQPEYILLEASGIAEPAGIAMTFLKPDLRGHVRLDSITCVVDADQVFAHPDYPALAELKMRQIGFSDMVIMNKVDLAGPERVEAVRAWIDDRVNNIRVVETSYCDVPYEILLGVGRFDPGRLADTHEGDPSSRSGVNDHSAAFSTWSYETDRPLSLRALENVAKKWPGSIYRCKGVVYAAEAPGRRAVLQVVGRRADVTLLDEWGDREPRTKIVVIGAPEGIDDEDLRMRFEACLSENVVGSNP